jgi:Alpha amylase, catalytic domain
MAGLTALDQVDWADCGTVRTTRRRRPGRTRSSTFLLVDRFSDGREDGYRDVHGQVVAGTTPPLTASDRGNAVTTPEHADRWRSAGAGWVGGTLGGVTSKIGYLARLGVTALWVSPVLRQVQGSGSYHGYGTQNFLEVDPHFGTTQDQYLRPISGDGIHFGLSRKFGGRMPSVVPWSRIFLDTETVCAINTDPGSARAAWVTVDAGLHRAGGC